MTTNEHTAYDKLIQAAKNFDDGTTSTHMDLKDAARNYVKATDDSEKAAK